MLEPGDMLYLPPRYAHDGVAEGECMTYSIGFRAPARGELARELLQRLAEDAADAARRRASTATRRRRPPTRPARFPAALQRVRRATPLQRRAARIRWRWSARWANT